MQIIDTVVRAFQRVISGRSSVRGEREQHKEITTPPSLHLASFAASLDKVIAAGVAISEASNGIDSDMRGHWINALYGRLCLNAMTVVGIMYDGLKGGPMDHYSIVVISRSVFEVCLMIAYLTGASESQDEQELKLLAVKIHDTNCRLRFFKGFQKSEQADQFRRGLEELRETARQNIVFQQLQDSQRNDLLSGKTVFIGGMRSVVRELGMSVDQFDSIYAYFSSYAHSMPMSFARVKSLGISYDQPAESQVALSGMASELVEFAITRAGKRLVEYFPIITKKIGEQTLAEFHAVYAAVYDFSKIS